MRLQLHLTPNTEPVPFNHLHSLTGALHKWLGPNHLHDGLSLYSFGWLRGGSARGGKLMYAAGTTWTISFADAAVSKRTLRGIMANPLVAFGMQVREVQEVPEPDFGETWRFLTDGSSVVLRQRRDDGSRAYLLWHTPDADRALTHVLRHKMEAAGLGDAAPKTRAFFDQSYSKAREKLIDIKGTKHKGSVCPVIVEGPTAAVRFAWLVGAGELTGSGFGGLR